MKWKPFTKEQKAKFKKLEKEMNSTFRKVRP
jgi:hypothetical protein